MANKDFRLNAWFQVPFEDQGALDEDELQKRIVDAVSGTGIVFQGGPVVFHTGSS